VSAKPLQVWKQILAAMILAVAVPPHLWSQANTDRQQQVQAALDQYGAAKTAEQRATVIEYLQHFDRTSVAASIVDHVLSSANGAQATIYNELVSAFAPEGCAAVIAHLAKANEAVPKGKLIVALRHCPSGEAIKALTGCLDDKRSVSFEARGPQPRRVCDLAYDELYFKLRSDARFHLDSSPRLKGIVNEKMPIKARDAQIKKLKARLAVITPDATAPTPSPKPSASPSPAAQ